MSARIPRHALTFMGNSARLAVKHGLKKGLTRAASKANPALLVIEAVVSVAEAVDSFLKLSRAKEHRDGLLRIIPHEEERLRLERCQLSEQLELAKEDIAQKMDTQRMLGKLVLVCANTCRLAWVELHAIRSSDLPDIEAFDRQLEMLDSAWSDLRHALGNYNESSA
jgi:hypothetical protein